MSPLANALKTSARVNEIADAAWREAKNAKDAQGAVSRYIHAILQDLYRAELRGGYFDALVKNGWQISPAGSPVTMHPPWLVVARDGYHYVGRGNTAEEAMEAALNAPEWRAEG